MPLADYIVRTTILSLVLLADYARSQQMTQASAIVTDRPDVTESSIVVPKRSLQFENGITWINGYGVGSVDFTNTLVRFALRLEPSLDSYFPIMWKMSPVTLPPALVTSLWERSGSFGLYGDISICL
jgi:hypothetical protein